MTAPPILDRLRGFASSIAPGVFLVGYVIGTGSVTTMAAAGAKYGLSLIWTGVAASLFTYVMFVAISPVVMPVMVVLTALLLLREDVVGPYFKNSSLMNVGLMATFLFTLYMLYTAVLGFTAL